MTTRRMVEAGRTPIRHSERPRVSNACLHAISREVDAQRWLRQLWRNLFCGQVHFPAAVLVTVEAQVLPLWIALLEELVHAAAHRAHTR